VTPQAAIKRVLREVGSDALQGQGIGKGDEQGRKRAGEKTKRNGAKHVAVGAEDDNGGYGECSQSSNRA
jgi:hypothetical protein